MKRAVLILCIGLVILSFGGCVKNILNVNNIIPNTVITEANKAIKTYITNDELNISEADKKYRTIGGYNENKSIIFSLKNPAVAKGNNLELIASKKIVAENNLKIKAIHTSGTITDMIYTVSTTSNAITVTNTLAAGKYSLKIFAADTEIESFDIIVIEGTATPGIIKTFDYITEDTEYLFLYGINMGQTGTKVIAENETGVKAELVVTSSATSMIVAKNILSAGKYAIKVILNDVESNAINLIVIKKDDKTPYVYDVKPNYEINEPIVLTGINFSEKSVVKASTSTGKVETLNSVYVKDKLLIVENTLTSGNYSLTISNDSLQSTAATILITNSIASIPKIDSIANTPAGENIVLNVSNIDPTDVTVKIIDSNGMVWDGSILSSRTNTITVMNCYQSGTYFAQIESNGSVSHQTKFVVENKETKPVIISIPSIYEGTDIVIYATGIDETRTTAAVKNEKGVIYTATIKSRTSLCIIIANPFPAQTLSVQLYNGNVGSDAVNVVVKKIITTPEAIIAPVITSIPAVDEGVDIIVYGTDIDTANVSAVITNAQGTKASATIKSKTSTSVTIANPYLTQKLTLQLFNGTVGSNLVSFSVNKVIVIPVIPTPVITSIPAVNEGVDIVVYGTDIDTTNISAVITNAQGTKVAATIKSKTSASVTIANPYPTQKLTLQLFNGTVGSNLVSFLVNKVIEPITPVPVITSAPAVNAGTDIKINGINFETETLTVKITNAITSAASILTVKTKTSTSIVLTNTLAAGNYLVKVFNGAVESNQVGLTIKAIIKTYKIDTAKCIGCSKCVKTCSVGAITKSGRKYTINTTKCTGCGSCVSACSYGAIK